MRLTNVLFNKISAFVIFTTYLLSNCYIGMSTTINKFYEAFTIVLTIVVILLYILFTVYKKKKLILVSFMLYLVFMAISCYLGTNSSIITLFHVYYPIIGIILYLIMSYNYNEEGTIRALNNSLNVLIFLNFLTIIIYPNGLYSTGSYNNNWFFKYDNLHVMMYLPSFILNLVVLEKYKNKLSFLSSCMNWIVIVLSIFICKSANTIVCFVIIFIFSVLVIYRNYQQKDYGTNIITNTNKLVYAYIILFVCIVILRMQDIFSWFIVNFLHKNLTFSNRTVIWDKVIEYIKQRPFAGYGIENTNIFISKMGNSAYTHAHNTILDILYKGGIISLFFFSVMVKQVTNVLKQLKGKYADMYKISFFSLLIMTIVEAREEKMGFYLVLFIIYCLGMKKEKERDGKYNVEDKEFN